MNRDPGFESTSETSRLLAELDQVIDQSSAVCDILRHYERLRDLESITGPSPATLGLRREIRLMEQRLREQRGLDADSDLA